MVRRGGFLPGALRGALLVGMGEAVTSCRTRRQREGHDNQEEPPIPAKDGCRSFVPYFRVEKANLTAVRALWERFVEKTMTESNCLNVGFAFNGDRVDCWEGYMNAERVLAHLENVDAQLRKTVEVAEITCLKAHRPGAEPDGLRGPMAAPSPAFIFLKYDFRKWT